MKRYEVKEVIVFSLNMLGWVVLFTIALISGISAMMVLFLSPYGPLQRTGITLGLAIVCLMFAYLATCVDKHIEDSLYK